MQPLVFSRQVLPKVWGGRALATHLGREIGEGSYGESWELSAHGEHPSVVAEGPLAGRRLSDLWCSEHRALVGDASTWPDEFPLLIKLLDCQELLSVQVHPNDALARQLGIDQYGKTEAWIVLDAKPTARIYAGLKRGVDRQSLERHLQAGTVDECLHSFTPQAGDCIFIPAGTVHTMGGGVLLAEVQQSSDATLRLFDWNRPAAAGRSLHIKESLQAIDWKAGPVAPCQGDPLPGLPATVRGEQLLDCAFFGLRRYELTGNWRPTDRGALTIWMVLEGSAELFAEGFRRKFSIGDTVLVPATTGQIEWRGDPAATLLEVTGPGGQKP